MCTLTYLPIANNQYIITSNRDESPLRKAIPPVIEEIGGNKVLFPKDSLAGGTWIAQSGNKRSVCLLNGAFVRHHHQPPYRISRGLMVLDSFQFMHTADFINQYDFDGIEPFTFVSLEVEKKVTITEFRWDGEKKHVKNCRPDKPYIWSSATLYKPELIRKREAWFKQWLKQNLEFTTENVRKFHRFGGEGNIYSDILMNRENKVRTVSITSIEMLSTMINMYYEDLLEEKLIRCSL